MTFSFNLRLRGTAGLQGPRISEMEPAKHAKRRENWEAHTEVTEVTEEISKLSAHHLLPFYPNS
jgi:hypothetical protein